MPIYLVTKDGETNNISAEESFVLAQSYDSYELVPDNEPEDPDAGLSAEERVAKMQRRWRDNELSETDYIVPLSDHPSRTATMTYRAALRAWPASSDFPATRPELGT